MNWIPYGRHAVLIHFAEKPDESAFRKGQAIVHALETKAPPAVAEFVPGFISVLVEFDLRSQSELPAAANELMLFLTASLKTKVPPGPLTKIPVRYDGPDLERVAAHARLTPAKVVKYHASATYKVALLGFAPGFPYLAGLPAKLHTPRLDSPRPRVAAGAVAIGGGHAGIYPVETPGGWNIIGHTEVRIFDAGQPDEQAFLLRPGDLVRFIPLETP